MVKFIKYSVALCILCFSGTISNAQAKERCDDSSITDAGLSNGNFKSENRNPQTIIYDIVSEFFIDDIGTKTKKVFILGYDGFREDALENILEMPQSGIKSIMNDGGLYHSYAGSYGNQETSTAPGWLSILSGQWAYELGVIDNNGAKSIEDTTLLDNAFMLGYAPMFIASWSTHFDVTYHEDVRNKENITFKQMNDDEATVAFLQEELANTTNSHDVIFGILEYTDHAGHATGYGNNINEYIEASQKADKVGYQLLQTIKNRESYDEEDWLIIITTDHGGIERTHGGQSEEERNTWFAINKDLSECR